MPGGRYALDLSADIDWANALPPHLLPPPPPPLPESHRVNSHNPTMIFNWPLPEDHPALQPSARPARREVSRTSAVVEPLDVRARGSRRELLRMRDEQVHREWTEEPRQRRPQVSTRRPRQESGQQSTAVPAPSASRAQPEQRVPQHSNLYRELLEAQEQLQREAETTVLQEVLPRVRTPPPPAEAASRSPTRDVVATPPPLSPPPAPPVQARGAQTVPATRQPIAGRRRAGVQGDQGQWELQDFSYESLLELGSMAVSTGLDKKQLERLKPVPYRGCNSSKFCSPADRGRPPSSQSVRLEECSICIEEVGIGSPSLELGCGHTFHFQCIIPWLARTNRCPTCRFEVLRR